MYRGDGSSPLTRLVRARRAAGALHQVNAQNKREGHCHDHGSQQVNAVQTLIACNSARNRAGNAKCQIQEGGIGAQRGPLVLFFHLLDRFDAQRREDQRETGAGKEGA